MSIRTGALGQGLRALRRTPGIALAAILSLALGIGANVMVFSWARAVLFAPISGAARQSELVVLDGLTPAGDDTRLSWPDFEDVRERATAFTGLAAYAMAPLALAWGDEADRVWAQLVSGDYFATLGVGAAAGRTIGPEYERAPGAHPVLVLSWRYWQDRFAADPGVLGRTVRVNGQPFEVIGIAPEGFTGAVVAMVADVWIPVMMQPQLISGDRLEMRAARWLGAQGRLRPGASLARARAELASLSLQLDQENPATNRGYRVQAYAPKDSPWGGPAFMRPIVAVLSVVVILLLLTACANIANLLVARALGRRREIATRIALGAGRWRLVRQLLAESMVLALLAGAAGTLLAGWSAHSLLLLIPPSTFPVWVDVTLDRTTLAAAVVLSVLTGLVFGLAPALHASRAGIVDVLKEEGGVSGGRGRQRAQRTLVTVQVAMVSVLLVATGLALRTLINARALDPGFETRNHLLATLDLQPHGYDGVSGPGFGQQLVDRVRSIPGVLSAGTARHVPLNFGRRASVRLEIDGYVPAENEEVRLGTNTISPGYLETMAISMIAGRPFTSLDREASDRVAIVNQAAARRYWRDGDAVGRRIAIAGAPLTIVGIARDIRYDEIDEGPNPHIYLPAAQAWEPTLVLHVRYDGAADRIVTAIRDQVKAIDPAVPLFDVRTMLEHMAVPVFQYRLAAVMLAVFGGLALLLAAIGLYGVISHGVEQRRREVGLRMSLGATAADIHRLIVGQGLGPVWTGMGAGIAIALVAAPLLASQLIGVAPRDPAVVITVAIVLLLVAAAALWSPARRASRVPPMSGLLQR